MMPNSRRNDLSGYLRVRACGERAFTLIEPLIVSVIIGALAAIAVPSFLSLNKAGDADAKRTVLTAAKAMEVCATENSGSYAGCTAASLEKIEPALVGSETNLAVTPATNHYEIIVRSERGNGAVVFALSRSADGTTTRTCSTGAADLGGCSARPAGTW
jgi:prepilin-type N-terminal cleavage/methylation domain-containing protein